MFWPLLAEEIGTVLGYDPMDPLLTILTGAPGGTTVKWLLREDVTDAARDDAIALPRPVTDHVLGTSPLARTVTPAMSITREP